MTKVFYHNDPDGWCSAFWVRKYLEQQKIPFTADDFIEMNYDRKSDTNIIKSSEKVFIVDFSFDMNIMWDIRCKTKDIIWIDHHKTAIEKIDLDALDLHNCGLQVDGVSACALTWAYLHGEPSGIFRKEVVKTRDNISTEYISVSSSSLIPRKYLWEFSPKFTQYIHLWDTWQWKTNIDASKIEAFITGFNSYVTGPCDPTFDNFLTDDTTTDRIIKVGYNMILFRDDYGKKLCNSIGKIIDFEGYKCFACNMPFSNSEWFKSIDPSTYDILMPYYYNVQTNRYVFSLYTSNTGIDVSVIARKYGGGGHFSSAGFNLDKLPF